MNLFISCYDHILVVAVTVPVVAAVAEIAGVNNSKGVVRFVATADDVCLIDGTVDGLRPGSRLFLHIHEYGDLSDGCNRLFVSFLHLAAL